MWFMSVFLCLLPGIITHTIGINSTRYQPNCNFTNSTDVSNCSEVVIIGPSSEVTHIASSMPYLEGPYLCTSFRVILVLYLTPTHCMGN